MNIQRHRNRSRVRSLGLALATLALWSIPVPASAAPESETLLGPSRLVAIQGRVYSAAELPPGADPPANPLSGDPAEEIVGDDGFYAVALRNLVRVRLLAASTDRQIGTDVLVTHDGGYLFRFLRLLLKGDAVRFEVRDAVSGELLLRSDPVSISPLRVQRRQLLVPGEVIEVGDAIRYPTSGNTALFTRVGKIEIEEITPSGMADVSAAAAAALRMPRYRSAPFGGNLFLFGAFSRSFYSGDYCYKIEVDGAPFSHPLSKVRYEVTPATGEVTAERRTLGPMDAVPGCYELTPMSETTVPGTEVMWTFAGMLALWPAAGLEGEKTVTVRLYEIATGRPFETAGGSYVETSLTLFLDNRRPDLEFNEIEHRGGPAGTVDLLANPCGIVDLAGGSEIHLRYTAYHPYLRDFYLQRVSNDGTIDRWAGGSYEGSDVGTAPGGEWLSRDATAFERSCAYALRLHAINRTTDGYHYIHWRWLEKVYYVNVPP